MPDPTEDTSGMDDIRPEPPPNFQHWPAADHGQAQGVEVGVGSSRTGQVGDPPRTVKGMLQLMPEPHSSQVGTIFKRNVKEVGTILRLDQFSKKS